VTESREIELLKNHDLGADRFYRIMDFRGTEGSIVQEIIKGFV